MFCDSRPSDDAIYRQNGEILNGELDFVLLPGTLPLSPREIQLSRGVTSFYRVVTSLARARVDAETINWNYSKLTHFLHPALETSSHTLAIAAVDPLRSHEVGEEARMRRRR